jgi:ABC-type antimicrobial peptide transport system permease subunit
MGVVVLAGRGVAALQIAATGLYSVIAYATALRQRETSIRMALGASPLRVVREILLEASVLASGGVIAGVVCAVLGARVIAHLMPVIPDLAARDVAMPGLALAAAALIAAAVPALREPE